MSHFRVFLLVATFGPLCLAGCGAPALFQMETTIRPDGSCDRAIWRPKDVMLPEGALGPDWRARWRIVEDVVAPPAFTANDPNPQPKSYQPHVYFHAEGSFPSLADIPAHYLKQIDDHPELGSSRLIRAYDRADFGLIVVHHWRETITNIVTPDDFRKARDQFIDVAIPMFRQAIDEVYGREYDVTALGDEVQKLARPLLVDLINIYYDMAANPEADPELLKPRLVTALRGAGVKLPERAENAADNKMIETAVQDHIRAMILNDVKRRDGQPMTEADVQAILNNPSAPRFKEVWEKYANDHKKEIDAKLIPPVVRMTGLYGYPPIFSGPAPQFVFRLRLPGWVVETNGTIDEKGRIGWQFNGGNLFPSGFVMSADAIDADRPAQTRLLGRVVIDDAKSARALRDLLAKDEALTDLVRRAAREGDPKILRNARMEDESRRARLETLMKLLQLAP